MDSLLNSEVRLQSINAEFMKNLYSKITGKVAIFTIFLIPSISSGAGTHEYQSMIRYDRVWESVCIRRDFLNTVNYMKFDGECEINGKIYHKLVTFNKMWVQLKGSINEDEYEYLGEVYDHEGYLREENGRVYTLAVGEYLDYDDNNYFDGALFTSDEPEPNEKLHDVLLYDFNCDNGNSLTAFSNVKRRGTFVDFNNISKTTVIVEGEERTNLRLGAFDVIEGIGPTYFGCLNYNEYDIPTGVWAHNYFNRLFDLDGNVIYESPEMYDYKLPDAIFSSVGTISGNQSMVISEGSVSFGEECGENAISIFDMNGKLVKSAFKFGRISMDTGDLHPGIYVVSAYSDDENVVNRKFIKK